MAANGQEKSREECLANLRQAIALILDYRREESWHALPPDAKQERRASTAPAALVRLDGVCL